MSEAAVMIAGVGMTALGVHADRSALDLAVEAASEALAQAAQRPQGVWVSSLAAARGDTSAAFEARLVDRLGLAPAPATLISAAGASGALAFCAAAQAVASGAVETALVVGVDKLCGLSPARARELLRATMAPEPLSGVSPPPAGVFALLAHEHMRRYGTTRRALSAVAVKNHANAVHNPRAHLRRAVTIEQVGASPLVADPLRMLDCAPLSDGAAALVLSCGRGRVRVAGIGCATGGVLWSARRERAEFTTTRAAGRRAYEQAGKRPGDIDVVEVHDAFTIGELCALETLGFFEPGQAAAATEAGQTAGLGPLPVNTDGGLKARGNPIGASGVAQLVTLTEVLTRGFVARDDDPARCGLAHSMGGCDATAVVTILERNE